MSLIKCPDCSHDVSTKAKSCPNCGYKITSSDRPLKKLKGEEAFAILFICFIFYLILGLILGPLIFLGGFFISIVMVTLMYFDKRKYNLKKS